MDAKGLALADWRAIRHSSPARMACILHDVDVVNDGLPMITVMMLMLKSIYRGYKSQRREQRACCSSVHLMQHNRCCRLYLKLYASKLASLDMNRTMASVNCKLLVLDSVFRVSFALLSSSQVDSLSVCSTRNLRSQTRLVDFSRPNSKQQTANCKF